MKIWFEIRRAVNGDYEKPYTSALVLKNDNEPLACHRSLASLNNLQTIELGTGEYKKLDMLPVIAEGVNVDLLKIKRNPDFLDEERHWALFFGDKKMCYMDYAIVEDMLVAGATFDDPDEPNAIRTKALNLALEVKEIDRKLSSVSVLMVEKEELEKEIERLDGLVRSGERELPEDEDLSY